MSMIKNGMSRLLGADTSTSARNMISDLFMSAKERQLRKNVDDALEMYSKYSYHNTSMALHAAEVELNAYLNQRRVKSSSLLLKLMRSLRQR